MIFFKFHPSKAGPDSDQYKERYNWGDPAKTGQNFILANWDHKFIILNTFLVSLHSLRYNLQLSSNRVQTCIWNTVQNRAWTFFAFFFFFFCKKTPCRCSDWALNTHLGYCHYISICVLENNQNNLIIIQGN